jgi:HSP20 family protein
MFDEWDLIPRRYAFRNFFGDIDREFSQAEEMLNRVFNTAQSISPLTADSFREASTFPYYYGYQITVGPDGKPHVREFGNIKPGSKGLVQQSNTREPLVDTSVDEKNNSLTITAEMPGISKEDIKLNASDKQIIIHAEKGDKKYHTEIPLNMEIEDTSAKATYSNGILELRLRLKAPLKSKGKDIKID